MPVIVIEVFLIFGGALLFGWWQLRSIKRDQARASAKSKAANQAATDEAAQESVQKAPSAQP